MFTPCPLKEKLTACQDCHVLPEEQFACFSKTALLTAGELLCLGNEKTTEYFGEGPQSPER